MVVVVDLYVRIRLYMFNGSGLVRIYAICVREGTRGAIGEGRLSRSVGWGNDVVFNGGWGVLSSHTLQHTTGLTAFWE